MKKYTVLIALCLCMLALVGDVDAVFPLVLGIGFPPDVSGLLQPHHSPSHGALILVEMGPQPFLADAGVVRDIFDHAMIHTVEPCVG